MENTIWAFGNFGLCGENSDLCSEQAANNMAEGNRKLKKKKALCLSHALRLGHSGQGGSWNRVEREKTLGFTLQVYLTLPGKSSTGGRLLSGSHSRQDTGESRRSTQEV